MAKSDNLKSYRKKRRFNKTSEPKAHSSTSKKTTSRRQRFVIQEHDASSHHFDFRIEVDGVFKSWAVPKGLSTDPREKRLAVAVEDHPLEYGNFEGVIPEGEYGAGTVIVWDRGIYRNITENDDGERLDMDAAMKKGHVHLLLRGKKLKGGWSLIHSKMRGDSKNWLLVKSKDDHADARRNPVKSQPKSVKSGKTVKQVAGSAKE